VLDVSPRLFKRGLFSFGF